MSYNTPSVDITSSGVGEGGQGGQLPLKFNELLHAVCQPQQLPSSYS